MEAKDTVMNKGEICEKLHGDHKWLAVTPWIVDKELKLLEAQAEITGKIMYDEGFEAGYEKLKSDYDEDMRSHRKAGIREVMELIVKDTRNFEVPLSLGCIVRLKEWR